MRQYKFRRIVPDAKQGENAVEYLLTCWVFCLNLYQFLRIDRGERCCEILLSAYFLDIFQKRDSIDVLLITLQGAFIFSLKLSDVTSRDFSETKVWG